MSQQRTFSKAMCSLSTIKDILTKGQYFENVFDYQVLRMLSLMKLPGDVVVLPGGVVVELSLIHI